MDALRTSTDAFVRREKPAETNAVESAASGRLVEEIGRGARARVSRALRDGRYVAVKQFDNPGAAAAAEQGYEFLSRNLPEGEKPKLVKDFHADFDSNTVEMEVLNDNDWVLSMGKNESRDRAELREHKLKSIPNFNAVVTRLFDALEKVGDRGIAVGPDVYFFKINRETGEMDYVYADTETAAIQNQFSAEQTTPMNMYWAAGVLNHFLYECVEEPDVYLNRVRQEANSRLWSSTSDTKRDRENLAKDFKWPMLNWKQRILANASWFRSVAVRYLKGAMSE